MNSPARNTRIAQALREEAARSVPDNVTLWPRIERRLHSRRFALWPRLFSARRRSSVRLDEWGTGKRPANWAWGQQRSSRASMPLVMVLLVVWGAVAFVAGRAMGAPTGKVELAYPLTGVTSSTSLNGTDLSTDSAGDLLLAHLFDTVNERGAHLNSLSHRVGLEQSAGGYSVQVKQVYADANRILVGYTGRKKAFSRQGNPQGATPLLPEYTSLYSSSLTADDGTWFPLLYDTSSSNATGASSHLLVYDASTQKAGASQLNLHLSLCITAFMSAPRCQAPYNFSFAAPVYKAETQVVPLNKVVTASGVDVTLEKIVVTPAAAQLKVRLGSSPNRRDWGQLKSTLAPGWHSSDPSAGELPLHGGSYVSVMGSSAQFDLSTGSVREHQKWTLSITDLYTQTAAGTAVMNVSLYGPWTFEFTMPSPAQP